MSRMRIDLDGVPLLDDSGRVVCLFRYRTAFGLLAALPESGDVTITWNEIASATVDLNTGKITIQFTEAAISSLRWLHGARSISGDWLDRRVLTGVPER
jgi:hypothetical protein